MERTIVAPPQVIAVASAPGRPGPQSLAPNLAVRAGMRARQANRKVCFFDTTTGSSIERHAGIDIPSVDDLRSGSLVPEDLDELVVQHRGWNLHLLRGPIRDVQPRLDGDGFAHREVLALLRKRFDHVIVATSVLDLYSTPGRALLPEVDQLCLEVPDNLATVLNTAMWLEAREPAPGRSADRPRVGFVFAPTGDAHLTVTEARAELRGVRHLGTLPLPHSARGVDPTAIAAAGPDPVVATALDTVLFELTGELAFKPRRNKWWSGY